MGERVTDAPKRMARISGGVFRMGSGGFYPEEAPVRDVAVDDFWIDERPVTIAQFRRFVRATGHQTTAEQSPVPGDYPSIDPDLLVPGSLVFRQTRGPVSLDDHGACGHWTPGACWHRPLGPGSDVVGLERHPVVHVTHADALAFARWAGKS